MRIFIRLVIILFLILGITFWIVLHSDYVHHHLAKIAAEAFSRTTGMPASIESVAFRFPCRIVAKNIVLGDPEQPKITIDKASIAVSPSELWHGRLPNSSRIALDHIVLLPLFLDSLSIKQIQMPPLTIKGTLDYDSIASKLSGTFTMTSLIQQKPFSLHGQFLFDEVQQLSLSFASLQKNLFYIEGNVHVSPSMDLDETTLHLKIPDPNLFREWIPSNLQGQFIVDCSLSGQISSPIIAFNWTAHQAKWQNVFCNTASGFFTYSTQTHQGTGNMTLAASIHNKLIDATTNIHLHPDNLLNLYDLSITAPGNSMSGMLSFSPNEHWIEGELNGESSDLSLFDDWLPEKTRGKVTYIATLRRFPSTGTIHMHSSSLKIGEAQFNNVHMSADIADLFISPQATLSLACDHASLDECTIENVTASTFIDALLSQWPFSIKFDGSWHEPFALQAQGKWSKQQNNLMVSLDSCRGNAAGIPLNLREKADFNITPEFLYLTPFSLSLGDGSLIASLNYTDNYIWGDMQFDNIPIQLLHLKSPTMPLSGILSGKAFIQGPPDYPIAKITLQGSGLKIRDKAFAKFPTFNGNLLLEITHQETSCSGYLLASNHPPIDISARLPIFCSLSPFSFNVDKDAPIEGYVTAAGEIAPILQLLLTDTTTLSGNAHASMTLSGSLNNPQLNGICEINQGTFESQRTGTLLRNLSAHIEASGSELYIKEIKAHDESGGSVIGSGHILLDDAQNFPIAIDMTLNNTNLLHQDYTQASFNGQLSLRGDAHGGTLSGTLDVSEAALKIPEKTSALMNTVDVTYINISDHDSPPQSFYTPPSSWPLHLDLRLRVPSNLSITGKDLSSEWKGEVSIKGTTQTPLFIGEVSVARGQYLFNGKPFAINQGTITLAGEIDKKTTLYIIASKDLDKVKVDVILKGPVKSPSISFRSNPPMPQREILSWLLFNRGTSEISAFQGSQLSESITNLDSNHQGPDVLTKIRTALGIDRLEICRDRNGDANNVGLKVGKYISDNIFISVSKSDVNSIALEASVTEKIKLQAEVGDDSEGQLLLKWKRDY